MKRVGTEYRARRNWMWWIGMDGRPGPGGAIEGLRCQPHERRLLDRFEDDARPLARGAVHAGAGHVAAPCRRAGLQVDIVKRLASKEVRARVGNAALDFPFAGGCATTAGVDDEAAELGAYSRKTRFRPGV